MRKKISLILIFLFFFSVVPIGGLWNNPPPIMAAMPDTYQMGLSRENKDDIVSYKKVINGSLMPSEPNSPDDMWGAPDDTGAHHPADYRRVIPPERNEKYEKPISQFAIVINPAFPYFCNEDMF